VERRTATPLTSLISEAGARIADRAIAVFDSGVGGLTVLAALRQRLPAEDLIYLGDTARVPYGARSAQVVTRYAVNNAGFLARFDPKLLVVACNTVSAVALPVLQQSTPFPVLGVVEPGATAAAAQQRGHIGLIGTPATIRSGAYQAAFGSLCPSAKVSAQACNLFVPLAEEGWTEGEVPRQVARTYLGGLLRAGIDTLVLGCTHYPLLRRVIAEAVGPKVALVDSADSTAAAAQALLAAGGLLRPIGGRGSEQIFVTDLPDNFASLAQRFFGSAVKAPEVVDITG
jgi:glutamate racemase